MAHRTASTVTVNVMWIILSIFELGQVVFEFYWDQRTSFDFKEELTAFAALEFYIST